MHSRTLVTVDIPEVKTDIETDREIQNTMVLLSLLPTQSLV